MYKYEFSFTIQFSISKNVLLLKVIYVEYISRYYNVSEWRRQLFFGHSVGVDLRIPPFELHKSSLFFVGVVTTIGKLDYEAEKSHNITILASDLGSPSLSSTAILIVNIIDVPEDIKSIERPVFAHRYYEVEVEENVPVPLKILTLNVTQPYRSHKLRYSIVAENSSDVKRTFQIDPRNGSLYIVESPDREQKALYELIIRLDQYKVGRDMTIMVYPVTNERLGNLGTKVRLFQFCMSAFLVHNIKGDKFQNLRQGYILLSS